MSQETLTRSELKKGNYKLFSSLQILKRNLSHYHTNKPFPSVKEIEKWNPSQTVDFLESKKGELYLEDNHIKIIEKERIAAEEISKALYNNLVYVFIDNSNITIDRFRIDYGLLLKTVQCERKLGSVPDPDISLTQSVADTISENDPGPDLTGKMKVLKIPERDIISNWENKDLIECFNTLNLFGWWHWVGWNVHMYFKRQKNLETERILLKITIKR
ncbi:4733_t:CDS:2 [Diversispora eburnea]|uniref:4733_t:CDS:1 n=1 Tax=Diversispora eburnea TaxID=1213867 RepID=A0A9N8YLU4_9GLOM|nr:4733_t:CDS:2 [Diversispora eburnea]